MKKSKYEKGASFDENLYNKSDYMKQEVRYSDGCLGKGVKLIIIVLGLMALSLSVMAQNTKDKFVDTTSFYPEKCRDTIIRMYKPVAMLICIDEPKQLYKWKKGYLLRDTTITLGDCYYRGFSSLVGTGSFNIGRTNYGSEKDIEEMRDKVKANINYPDKFYYEDKKTLFRIEVLNHKFL